MQLKKAIGRAETMRQGFVEACEWPQHFGGHPDLIGWWSLDLAAAAPLDGVDALVAALSADSNEHAAFGRGRCLLGGILSTVAAYSLSGLLGGSISASSGAALFRAGPELRTAVSTPFMHERLFIFELVARLLDGLRIRAADKIRHPRCVTVHVPGWREDGDHRPKGDERTRIISLPCYVRCIVCLHEFALSHIGRPTRENK